MSDDDRNAGDTPFSPEQLAWLDRLIEARQASRRPPATDAATGPPPTDPPATSSASQPGE